MNDQRPTRWPWSADSSRNAGSSALSARSFRTADPGVSQSSTNVTPSGIRLCEPTSERVCSSVGAMSSDPTGPPRSGAPAALGATAIEHPLGVRERAPAAGQEHEQVVEHVRRLFIDTLRGLLARRARALLGLLHRLLADPPRIVEQSDRVGARGTLARPLGHSSLEARGGVEKGPRGAARAG